MSLLSNVDAFLDALGEARELTGIWPTLADVIEDFGQTLGLPSAVIAAAQDSTDVEQFFEKLSEDIIGGNVGAAVAVELVSCLADIGAGDVIAGAASFLGPESALGLAGIAVGLPEIVVLGAAALAIFAVTSVVSSKVEALIQEAYDGLAASLNNAPAPASWTEIGEDSSGDSLLLDAVFSNAIGAALGLGNDSTMLVDIASSATESSSSPLDNGDVAANSLLTDANLIGTLVEDMNYAATAMIVFDPSTRAGANDNRRSSARLAA